LLLILHSSSIKICDIVNTRMSQSTEYIVVFIYSRNLLWRSWMEWLIYFKVTKNQYSSYPGQIKLKATENGPNYHFEYSKEMTYLELERDFGLSDLRNIGQTPLYHVNIVQYICCSMLQDVWWYGCMVVGFTTTYVISSYHHQSCEFESCSWWGVFDTTLCDKVCQWLSTFSGFRRVFWFPPPIKLTSKI
jgi:hypothetical protein